MADEGTQYSSRYEDPTPAEALEELDWAASESPPIEEAAALIYEVINDPDATDSRDLYTLLNEVPPDFRQDVMATMLNQYARRSSPEPNEELNTRDSNEAADHQDEAAVHDAPESGLHDDAEQFDEALQYVENVAGAEFARKLEQVMHDSRNLSLRAMNGDPATYGREPHATYLECVTNIENAVMAKEVPAFEAWNDDQRREAVQHEVHRMAYRLNLEIQDRLITQFQDGGHMASLARTMDLSPDVVNTLEQLGNQMANDAIAARHIESPTYDDIAAYANMCLIHYAIENAAQLRDEAAVRELMQSTATNEETTAIAQLAVHYINPTLVDEIQAAVQTAARWNDEENHGWGQGLPL